MDKTISAAEANRAFSRLLREVQGGETFVVTNHGQPVARIVPASSKTVEEQMKARKRLLARLDKQPARNLGPWRREEGYE